MIQDEVLAHRIGLVPLNVDPRFFEMRPTGGVPTDRNTLVFRSVLSLSLSRPLSNDTHRLNVTCERIKKPAKDGPQYLNDHVTSGDLEWVAQGEQESVFAGNPPAATNKVAPLTFV